MFLIWNIINISHTCFDVYENKIFCKILKKFDWNNLLLYQALYEEDCSVVT